jgi:hypothetical protein
MLLTQNLILLKVQKIGTDNIAFSSIWIYIYIYIYTYLPLLLYTWDP